MGNKRFVACPTCEGRGTHVNPAVDGNGLTAEDFDEAGPDFLDDYLGGVYDVPCEECGGQRVVPECSSPGCTKPVHAGMFFDIVPMPDDIDRNHEVEVPYSGCWAHLRRDEREWAQSEAETAAIYAAERRMGA